MDGVGEREGGEEERRFHPVNTLTN
jgi:hypothetical protein